MKKNIISYEEALERTTYGYNLPNIGQVFEMRENGQLLGTATVGKGNAIWKWYSDRWFQRDNTLEAFKKWAERRGVTLHAK